MLEGVATPGLVVTALVGRGFRIEAPFSKTEVKDLLTRGEPCWVEYEKE